mmetsp:Transcript_4266/g.7230  ORF Transcript_4266/g.7230 Transcript_4266/m.7230 type:complete len:487 (-) Transcript_4266:253-1713(-)
MTQMKGCKRCTQKKAPKYFDSVKPQKLITELNDGELLNDDYYGRSYDLLPSINTSIPSLSNQKNDNTFQIYELHKILNPNYKSLEHGFTRMSDGLWYMATKTNLEHCTGEMVEWWFNHCDSTERFKWWHPTSNVHGEFDPTFYAVQPEDRLVGHAIGHRFTCVKKMYSGGMCSGDIDEYDPGEDVLQHIDYLHPAEFINTDELPAAGITALVVGKLSYRDHHMGEITVGHVCHVVREVMGSVSLVTRMWLGHIDKTDLNFPSPRFVNFVGNTLLYRYMKFTYSFIKNIWIQMVQESNCLAAMLPDFYAQELIELEQRKLRNIALLEAAKDMTTYEEFSEEEEDEDEEKVDDSQRYVEHSASEESMPDVKEEGGQRLASTTNDYAEESMSDEDQGDGQGQYMDAPNFQSPPNTSAMGSSGNNYYEYDSHDDDKDQRTPRRSKSGDKTSRKDKSGQGVGGKTGVGGQQAAPSSAMVTMSSRVGKGIGV